MEKPAGAVSLDRDARVAARVTGQWDEENLRWQAFQPAHRFEAKPPLAVGAILSPPGIMLSLRASVAVSLRELPGRERGFELGPVNVDEGVRKIGEAARVIQVQVSDHDVPDVPGRKTQGSDSRERGFCGIQPRVHDLQKGPSQALPVIREIRRAESGINKDQPGPGRLDQQAVADQMARRVDQSGGAGAEGGAVQMVDSHRGAPRGKSIEGQIRL